MARTVRAVMRTDPGVERTHNEDAAYLDGDGRFVVLADGMGGQSAGELASAMAVGAVRVAMEEAADELAEFARSPTFSGRERIRALVEAAVRRANDDILAHGVADPTTRGMGTTLEVVVTIGGEAFVSHVGDSRTYLIRRGAAIQLTADHTVAEQMKKAGVLTPAQVEVSPMRSVLTSAIGVSAELAIDHAHVWLRAGDRLLVCSDGLHDYFTHEDLGERLSLDACDAALADLLAQARARGGHDNITGIIIEQIARAPAEDDADHVDPLDDEAPTNPIAMPLLPPSPAPLIDVGEDTLVEFIEHALAESSRPHR